ncbi:MAG: TIM barrel protein [Candidatus Micrarchaeota archaeon]
MATGIGVAGSGGGGQALPSIPHALSIAVAGVPLSTPAPRSTLEGVRMCGRLGIRAMEVEFVQGVRMKDELAKEVGEEAKKLGISLSVHGPYFINLCSEDELKMKNTHRHILSSAQAAHHLHASPVVFHPGFYQGRGKKECEARAKKELRLILEAMASSGFNDVVLGAELTGKKSAYGDADEIIELARHFGLTRLQPVIDFGHYHARIQRIQSKADYESIFDHFEDALGSSFKRHFHCHYSEIQYTEAGEGKHLPIGSLAAAKKAGADLDAPKGAGGPPYLPLLEVLHERKYDGTLVCESPAMEKDVLVMQKSYGKMA